MEKAEKRDFIEGESSKYTDELNSYKESLKMVISEKSEIEASMKQMQNTLKMKDGKIPKCLVETITTSHFLAVEITSLKQMLLDSEQRANENLEKAEAAAMDTSKVQEMVQMKAQLQDAQMTSDELRHTVTELQSKLGVKERETTDLKAELDSSNAKLEMVELNLSQLRAATAGSAPASGVAESEALNAKDAEIADLKTAVEEAKKREAELSAYIQSASVDREQIIHQYTTYSQQLTAQIESVTAQLNQKVEEGQHLARRESELVEHVAGLEDQIQKLRSAQKEQELKVQAAVTSTSEVEASEVLKKETEMLRQKVREMDMKLSQIVIERDALQGNMQQKVRLSNRAL